MSIDADRTGDPGTPMDPEVARDLGQAGGPAATALSDALLYADALFDTVREPLVVLDEDLTVRRANQAFYRTFQVGPEAAVGRRIYDLGNGQWDIPRLRALLEEIIPEDTAFDGFEVDPRFETIGRRVMILNARRIEIEAARPAMILLAIEDVTERRQAEREAEVALARLEEAQRVGGTGSWAWDLPTGEVTWSDHLYRLFGFEPGEIDPSFERFLEEVHPEDREEVEATIRTCAEEKVPMHLEYRVRPRDGRARWHLAQGEVEVDADGEPVRMTGIVQDITERVETQREIARHAEELERSNLDLERFAYIASHDLQEPLRAISGFLDLLARRYEGQLDDKAQHYISRAVTGAERMRSLIEGLLAYSRVESRGHPPEPVDVESLLGGVEAMLATQIDDTGGTITHGPLPTVLADREQLAHVLQNLISNALKFHREATAPQIHVTATDQGEAWRFSVTDDGVGIPEGREEEVFEIFRRLHPRDVYPGDGVGLALCRRIIDRHGGRIWAQSPPDGQETGTAVHFTLPKELEIPQP